MKKLTTEEFIKKAIQIHGNKYDYSKVEYVNSHSKVCIICPEHGEFWQEANAHLKGQKCPKCSYKKISINKKNSTSHFIEKAKQIHGNKYDYSKVDYIDNKTKVCIICPEHGEFWQKPSNHLNGSGCKKCGFKKIWKNRKKTTGKFIEEAKQIHNNRYDYSKVEYATNDTKVCIICPEHGEFWQTPSSHLKGCGCRKCGITIGSLKQVKKINEFIKKAKSIHGNKYDYSKVEYINSRTKVCIICPEHGEFWQEPSSHLKGCGCPICKESKLEKTVRTILNDFGIKYIEHCNKTNLKWIGNQHLDFFIPKLNIAIECQGIQHYKKDSFYAKKNGFDKIKKLDENKKQLCKINNIKLIYIPYNLSNEQISKKIGKMVSKA